MTEEWRRDLVERYGEALVSSLEESTVPWPCRDTMDGRRWCRVHDAHWPSNIDRLLDGKPAAGCEAWLRERDR